jgi:hypothetical protein
MARDRLIFHIDEGGPLGLGGPLGVFRGRGYPTAPGRVRYEPYRGAGHARLAGILAEGATARCWFFRRGRRVDFEVVGEQFVLGPPGGPSSWYLDISWVGRGAADA